MIYLVSSDKTGGRSPLGLLIVSIVLLTVATSAGAGPALAPTVIDTPPARVAGADRTATSAAFLGMLAETAAVERVVVVPRDSTGVALAAAGLAGVLDAGVVLADAVPSDTVTTAVDTVHPIEVLTVGDAARADAWQQDGRVVTVLDAPGGPPALAAEMAREIARRHAEAGTPVPTRVLLASTTGLPDALAASAWAHEEGLPLLLTAASALDPHARFVVAQLGITDVTILGGTAAVSATVEEELRSSGLAVERVAGPTREHTALAVAARRGVGPNRVLVAAGDDPADAAAAGPWASVVGAALLPSGPTVAGALAERCGHGVVVQVAGGPVAVPEGQVAPLLAAAERCDGPNRPLTVRLAVAAPEDPDVVPTVVDVVADARGWSSRRLRIEAVGQDETMGLIVTPDGCGGAAVCRRGRTIVVDATTWRAADPDRRTRLVNLAVAVRLGVTLPFGCTGGVLQPLACPDGAPWPTDDQRRTLADTFVPSATIALTGDVHAERHIGSQAVAGQNPLDPVRDVLTAADMAVVNLETPLSTRGAPVPKTYTFRGPPEMAARLVEAGVDVASLANNHGLDYGPVAMLDTLDHADAVGLHVVGAGADATAAYAPALVETPAGTVAVVGLTRVLHTRTWEATATRAGLASAYDEAAAVAAVRAADAVADHVVVAIHWGAELADCPNADQRHLATLLVDAGADVIAGHHPHVLQGVQPLRDGLVAYSLGNFVWYHNRAPSRYTGVLTVELPLLDQPSWSFLPAEIGSDGRPHPAAGGTAAAITERLTSRSPGGAAGCGFPS